MSAPGRSQALNLKPTLRPLTPVETAAPTKNPDKFPSGNNESSKATFSRLLAHSRAAAAAAARPPEPPARPTTNPASPPRAARTSSKDADRHADAAPVPASDARARPSAAARSGGATAANDAPDATADADAATSTDAAASTAHAPPASADGTVNALAALLAGGLPPAPTVLPPEIQAGTVTANAAADPLRPAATPLTALGKAGAGPAGIDTAASIATGAKGTDARAALAIVGAATGDHGPGQIALPGDPKAALDATAASGALPNAVLPNAALAHLAALAAGVGKADEAPKTSTELDTLPLGAGLSIPGQGVAHLVRSIDSPAAATATVSTAVGDPGFHEALAAQVSVFARGGLSKAELHLNPAELGPVSVQITMNGDQARVDFGADRAQTRQAIEAGWAELATSLQDAGFTLSGGGVSEQAGRQASEREAASQNGRTARSAVADDEPVASIVAARPRAGSALDTYA